MIHYPQAGAAAESGDRRKLWRGKVPAFDGFADAITDEFVDGATIYGPWALMSPRSFAAYGRGTGRGVGQRYRKAEGDKWERVQEEELLCAS